VHFIANTVYPRGAMQQLTVGAKSGLYALDCGQLWYQRNAILWAAGYCFQERRAVRVFGNAACAYVDVIVGLRGIEWVSLGSEGPRKLCIS
jgi:hypothetical protein